MKKPTPQKVEFRIERQGHGELSACFEQNNLKYSRLSLFELEEYEYFVGDSQIPDTISGHADFQLIKSEATKNGCPYEIKFNTNLVRNDASLDVYEYVDHLLATLNVAIQNATPIHFEIRNDLEEMGWYMICN